MPATSIPTNCRRITRSATRSPAARRSITSPTARGAPNTPPTVPSGRAASTGAANFLFPFWTQQPQGEFARLVHARAWVPLDDHHTMFYYLWWKHGSALPAQPRPLFNGLKPLGGARPDLEFLPDSTDWLRPPPPP